MRKEFPAKIKVLAFKRAGGRCEGCGAFLVAGKSAFDHDNPDGLTGEPTLENCRVLCLACHGVKTGQDITNIAKAKRRERRHMGIRKDRTITAWRKFDGTIVRAPRHRGKR